jgi:hypothetical protein
MCLPCGIVKGIVDAGREIYIFIKFPLYKCSDTRNALGRASRLSSTKKACPFLLASFFRVREQADHGR